MINKLVLLAITLVLLITSCSKNDDVEDFSETNSFELEPTKKLGTVIFSVTTTTPEKTYSKIDIESDNSMGRYIPHKLPFKKQDNYVSISPKEPIKFTYTSAIEAESKNLFGPQTVSTLENPYDVTLKMSRIIKDTIKEDSGSYTEIFIINRDTIKIAEKTFTISQTGIENTIEYSFDDYELDNNL